jgi:hypothetical protein
VNALRTLDRTATLVAVGAFVAVLVDGMDLQRQFQMLLTPLDTSNVPRECRFNERSVGQTTIYRGVQLGQFR